MMNRFESQVAIVTGAGSVGEGIGNGKAIALMLAEEGCAVVVIDVVQDRADETRDLIERDGGTALALGVDVSQDGECRAAVEAALDRFGKISVLVNNVGIHGAPGTAVDVDPDAWDLGMAVNVKSVMLMAKYAVPSMIASGRGAIVNISSTAGLIGGNTALLYPTSKGALVNMTRAMAAHHGPAGVRVNCVAPGMIFSPRIEARGLSPEMRQRRIMKSLLHTEGTAWDVAKAVLFLASDDSRWITGVTLPVDAGLLAGDLDVPLPEPARAGTDGALR